MKVKQFQTKTAVYVAGHNEVHFTPTGRVTRELKSMTLVDGYVQLVPKDTDRDIVLVPVSNVAFISIENQSDSKPDSEKPEPTVAPVNVSKSKASK